MDHKAECYKLMIPYKKYETIYEETNGLVNDLHYGEKGSIDLGNDLIKHIDEFFEPIFMRGAEFFDDRSDMKIEDITPVETIKKIIKSII